MDKSLNLSFFICFFKKRGWDSRCRFEFKVSLSSLIIRISISSRMSRMILFTCLIEEITIYHRVTRYIYQLRCRLSSSNRESQKNLVAQKGRTLFHPSLTISGQIENSDSLKHSKPEAMSVFFLCFCLGYGQHLLVVWEVRESLTSMGRKRVPDKQLLSKKTWELQTLLSVTSHCLQLSRVSHLQPGE